MSFEVTFMGDASLKNRFTFRLGTASCIIPGDLRGNVAFLADKADDIELVLFESHEIDNLPDAATLRELKNTADRHDHCSLAFLPDGLMTALVKRLGRGPEKPLVLTVGICDQEALNQSLNVLRRVLQ